MRKIVCKICGNDVQTIRDQQFDMCYYYCEYCEFIFIDERGILSKEEELQQYELHENSIENEGYVNMFKRFIEKSIIPYKDNIRNGLDFGCGPGPVLAELLKREGLKVDIYDPYFAPKKVFESKRYDLITSTEVFEHLKEPIETLKLLKEHLNGKGILAIMTLFHPNNEEKFKKWWYRRDPTHISFYTPRTFRYLANKFHMDVLKIDQKNICVLQNC